MINDRAMEAAWNALKQRCCADPTNATQCVMVRREPFEAAVRAYLDFEKLESLKVQADRALSEGGIDVTGMSREDREKAFFGDYDDEISQEQADAINSYIESTGHGTEVKEYIDKPAW